jgi:outer membrane protein W
MKLLTATLVFLFSTAVAAGLYVGRRSPAALRTSTMRHLWVIVAITASSGTMAETPTDNAVLRACLTEVMTNYAKAKFAFYASKGADVTKGTMPSLTIDYYLAERRLEEAYCVQYARCVVTGTNIPPSLADTVAGTQFASCLADEAAERAK